MSKHSIAELKTKTVRMRRHIVSMAAQGKTSHVGSALSCVEILAVLYFNIMDVSPRQWDGPDNDRFILSKGHGVMAWYAALAEAGFLALEQLETYAADGGHLGEHPSHTLGRGIQFSTGSLGHGLAVGTGQALAKKMDQRRSRVFVMLSDGECNEGSVWEAAMGAAHQKLDNLVAIIDDNHMQAMGPSRQICGLGSLKDKWAAFGWDATECDGHDINALVKTIETPAQPGKPRAIIARTLLGKGVSFMEDDILWHYQVPSDEDLRKALAELQAS